METKIVSNYAVVTKKMERFIQITCKDLPKKHHNRIVNVARYPEDLPLKTEGKVVYVRGYNYGLLQFIKEEK